MPISAKWILVTGCNGFIGSNLCLSLLKNSVFTESNRLALAGDIDVVGVDFDNTLGRQTAKLLKTYKNFKFISADCALRFLSQVEKPPAAIVHNGACSSTEETRVSIFKELNVEYSKALWNYSAEVDIPFIYASSAGVYGMGLDGFSDENSSCHRFKPLSLYAKSKHEFDLWVLEQTHQPPFWAGLRYFNVYGPLEQHKGRQASMLWHIRRQIMETGLVRLYRSTDRAIPDGEQLRDFVCARDVVEVTTHLLSRSLLEPLQFSGFVNIGTGNPRSWLELVREVGCFMGEKPSVEFFEMPLSLSNQYQNRTCADLSKLLELLPEFKVTQLEQGLVWTLEAQTIFDERFSSTNVQ